MFVKENTCEAETKLFVNDKSLWFYYLDRFKRWQKEPVPSSSNLDPWEKQTQAIDIEIAAYAALTLIVRGAVSTIIPIVTWLINQRNAYGGFISTQVGYSVYITKTRLFKYIENFTSENWKFSDKNLWYFSYFCSKHRLWVPVRTASARRF